MKKTTIVCITIVLCSLFLGCTDVNTPEEQQNEQENLEQQEEPNNGTISGVFSISTTSKVQFSRGNLQYNMQTTKWRFAENQEDIIGSNNEKIQSGTIEWMDMFLWGSSGYGNTGPLVGYNKSGNISNTMYDWGAYNAILNGGGTAGTWRTLTASEWEFLINKRPNCYALFAKGVVGGRSGWIILPDDWQTPNNLEFKQYVEFRANRLQVVKGDPNVYTSSEWKKMAANGAVFLPLTGYMLKDEMKIRYYLYNDIKYWTSTDVSDYTRAYAFDLSDEIALGQKNMNCVINTSRQVYLPVRLVRDYPY